MAGQHKLGQYFTTSTLLQDKVLEFIQNNPSRILEPSVGRGDLVEAVLKKKKAIFDMYEIDGTIEFTEAVRKRKRCLHVEDFLSSDINKCYATIIGNPPYVKHKKGNLYIDFVQKCFHLLEDKGELIFIVPSDFLKLTSSSKLLQEMMLQGTFTDVFHANNETLFETASIDVIVFRYCKDPMLDKIVKLNDEPKHILCTNGLVTFSDHPQTGHVPIGSLFDIYVGIVSGMDSVYKNETLGNIDVLVSQNNVKKFICVGHFPSEDGKINEHLLAHKDNLKQRKIRKFSEGNWYEWGALRNMTSTRKHWGKPCIYISNLSRKSDIAFVDKVQYFGGALLMMIPKEDGCNLEKVVQFLNSTSFRSNFTYAGRFKIGHRQLCNSLIDKNIISS